MNQLANIVARRFHQLELIQWMTPQAIVARQFQQLALLAQHCVLHSDHFAKRLKEAQTTIEGICNYEGIKKLPLLSRKELLNSGETIYCREIPKSHGTVFTIKTSGSTGEPVLIKKTDLSQLDLLASCLQDQIWHKRDFNKRFCVIRDSIKAYAQKPDWGLPVHPLFKTGPSLELPVTSEIGELAQWIADFQPNTLLLYPNVLRGLTEYCIRHRVSFNGLEHIRTIGEMLSAENRQSASALFHSKVEDLYSSNEVGTIAIECPISGLYHVMADNLIVEILNEDGEHCASEETGRVVITDLHNFATPIIRYDIGDYAEVGPPCSCGKGLPTLKKICGRERNLIVMSDGRKYWPRVGAHHLIGIAPVQQCQLIQESFETIEVRLVTTRPLTSLEESTLCHRIQNRLGFPFHLRFNYFSKPFPRAANGKFEEFICSIGSAASK